MFQELIVEMFLNRSAPMCPSNSVLTTQSKCPSKCVMIRSVNRFQKRFVKQFLDTVVRRFLSRTVSLKPRTFPRKSVNLTNNVQLFQERSARQSLINTVPVFLSRFQKRFVRIFRERFVNMFQEKFVKMLCLNIVINYQVTSVTRLPEKFVNQ